MTPNELTPDLAAFIEAQTSIFLATASANEQPHRPATLGVAVVYLKCEIRDGVGLVKLALFDSDFSGGVRHGQGASIQCGGLRRDRYPKKRPASTKGRNVGCGRITRSHVVRRTTENGTSWKFAAGWTGAAHATGIGRGASACRAIKPPT